MCNVCRGAGLILIFGLCWWFVSSANSNLADRPPELAEEVEDVGEGEGKTVEMVAGKLSGTIVWRGDPSALDGYRNYDYDVAAEDKAICGRGGQVSNGKRKNPWMPLGAKQGDKVWAVTHAVAWLDLSGVDESNRPALPAAGAPITLDNKDCEFAPHMFLIPGNATLLIKTSDGNVSHNSKGGFTTWDGGQSEPFNPQLKGDKKHAHKGFPGDGVLRIVCSQHYWMNSIAIVHGHPCYAKTGDDGKFSFDFRIPKGTYKVNFWRANHAFTMDTKEGKPTGLSYAAPKRWSRTVDIDEDGNIDLGTVDYPK